MTNAPAPAPQQPRAQRSGWVWAGATLAGFVIACFAIGFARAMVVLGIFAVLLAVVALGGRDFGWLRAVVWKAFTLGAGLMLLVGGAAATAATGASAPTASRFAELPSPTATANPSPSATPTPEVTTEGVVVTEAVPFAKTTQDDANLDVGTTAVAVVGVDGVRTITYLVRYRDGVETDRRIVSNEVTTPPVDEVTSIGTRQPPPPPPPPAAPSCHPSYEGVCVPFASDVDCAGGSGNGPEYVRGPLRVVGWDEYDLDRDGDGIACDR